MNAVDHFEIDGAIGLKKEPGKLCIARRKVAKGSGSVQHELTEFFIYTVVYSRLNRPSTKVKIDSDRMTFYRGHHEVTIFPKGEKGQKYVVSTGVDDPKLVLLCDYLCSIRFGEGVGFQQSNLCI